MCAYTAHMRITLTNMHTRKGKIELGREPEPVGGVSVRFAVL